MTKKRQNNAKLPPWLGVPVPRCTPKARRATRGEIYTLERGLRKWRPGIVPGGLTEKRPRMTPKRFNQNQLAIGTKVELEHTSNPGAAVETAMDRLLEDRCYYAKLEKMERKRR